MRVSSKSRDEIDRLSHTFHQMAGRIVSQLDDLKQQDNLRRELVANVSHERQPRQAGRSRPGHRQADCRSARRPDRRGKRTRPRHLLQFLTAAKNPINKLYNSSFGVRL